jgi:hypothetical protein
MNTLHTFFSAAIFLPLAVMRVAAIAHLSVRMRWYDTAYLCVFKRYKMT